MIYRRVCDLAVRHHAGPRVTVGDVPTYCAMCGHPWPVTIIEAVNREMGEVLGRWKESER